MLCTKNIKYSTVSIGAVFYCELFGLFHTKEKPMPMGKYFQKEGIIIIQITQGEALALNKNYGIKFGVYGGISTTHTKHNKKYFLTETRENVKSLNKIRESEHNNSVVKGDVKVGV